MAVPKAFTVEEGQAVQFLSEFFNTINHPQFATRVLRGPWKRSDKSPLASVNSRVIQLALKCSF